MTTVLSGSGLVRRGGLFAVLGGLVVLAGICARGPAQAQDPSLKPTYGSVTLNAGFPRDPHVVKLEAGGEIKTNKGGFAHYVARAPDFSLNYNAGNFALTIYTESKADTTLLINLPDGTWIADDDSGGNLNALLKFNKPQSGRYDIWVGTIGKGTAPAVLKITELK
jgi:hypothetical protein